jgi:hypothetical protein
MSVDPNAKKKKKKNKDKKGKSESTCSKMGIVGKKRKRGQY